MKATKLKPVTNIFRSFAKTVIKKRSPKKKFGLPYKLLAKPIIKKSSTSSYSEVGVYRGVGRFRR